MSRKTAVFTVSCQFTVYPAIKSGLNSFKIKEDIHSFPMGRYGKFTYVCSYRIVIGWNMRRIGREGVSYVSIDGGVKSLQFPASRNLYGILYVG